MAVRVVQRRPDLLAQSDDVFHRQLALPVEPVAKTLTLGQRHHVIEEAASLARIEERQDMRMLQRRRGLDFGEESLAPDHRGELGSQDLERDVAIVAEVPREVDRGHTTSAELAFDPVVIGEGGDETRIGVEHSAPRLAR